MEDIEKKEEVKNRSRLVIIILTILLVLLLGILIYILFIKKPPTKVEDNNSKENINEEVGIDVDKVSKDLVELISDFDGVMLLKTKGDKPASYTASNLSKENNSDIILRYALQNIGEKDNDICKYNKDYDSECYIKVSDLNSKLGLNIGNNIKTNTYVKGIVKKDNEDYYKVIFPATEYDVDYYVRDCSTSSSDNILTIKCDVYEVIEMYDPYEEAKVGIGEFIYNTKDKLAFDKFVFTMTNNVTDDKKKENSSTEKIKISENSLYINGKKVTDVEFGHLTKDYIYDLGDLILVSYCVSHCKNYFIDENGKVIGTIGKIKDTTFSAMINPKYDDIQISEVKGKDIYILSYNYNTQDASSICNRSREDEVSVIEKYTYKGNGKFSDSELINTNTVGNLIDNGWARCE